MAGEMYESEESRASLRCIVLEAMLWATPRANPKDPIRCLRSAKLAPHLFEPSRHETVFDVIWQRHIALEKAGLLGGEKWQLELPPGRLLAWERDSTVDDGVGESLTGGYLDSSELPPWDTWIAYIEQSPSIPQKSPYRSGGRNDVSCLVSWVPGAFIDAVARAIKANANEALYWLSDSKLPIADVLRADKLLI